nr:MAG TPA: hypothetical protein [Caudoviricetes sp.]
MSFSLIIVRFQFFPDIFNYLFFDEYSPLLPGISLNF